MKKLLIGLLALGSISAFASVSVDCEKLANVIEDQKAIWATAAAYDCRYDYGSYVQGEASCSDQKRQAITSINAIERMEREIAELCK